MMASKPEPVLRYYLAPAALKAGAKFSIPREGDAGFDLPSAEHVTLEPAKSQLISTGVHLEIPLGWVGLIRDRSSVALKGGCCTAGVIDSSYRGEVKVMMHNLGPEPLEFNPGERIAQCVVVQHLSGKSAAAVESFEQLADSARKSAGFGSTGR